MTDPNPTSATLRVAVTGASGLIGTALVERLRRDGHTVIRLVRHEPRAADEARWDPMTGTVDPAALDGTDAVV
ncbi:MAG TPA: NAD-dependent epimerase/dehydratase family protein, partial [Longimicrobium sp.]